MIDISTVGADPDPDEDADPSEGDPTPVDFAEAPSVGVAKAVATAPVNRNDGSFALAYQVLIENTGDVDLAGLTATDDLTAVLVSPLTFSVTGVSSTMFTVNEAFDGATDTGLLAGTDSLAPGASGTLTIEIIVWPNGEIGPFDNTVQASATSPAGTGVTDLSNVGTDPDPDGDGDPTNNNVPTPVDFPAFGTLTGRIWMDIDGDGTPDVDEADIVGAVVLLTCAGPDGAIGSADDMTLETTITTPPGAYTFSDVPPGSCEVHVDPDSLPTVIEQRVDPDAILDGRTLVDVPFGGSAEANFGYVEPIDLAVTKTAGVEAVEAGDSITWIVTVTNVGDTTAVAPITVTDTLPSAVDLLLISSALSCSDEGDSAVCTRDTDLAPGASFRINLTTTAGDPGTAANTVTVAGAPEQTDENLDNNSDTATVSVGELPHTGLEVRTVLIAGLLLLLLGAVLVLYADRRPRWIGADERR